MKIKLILATIICILMCSCSPGVNTQTSSINTTDKICSVDISTFNKLKKDMSQQEVYSIVGLPSRHAGFGIAYDVYDLPNDTSVWIAWQKDKTAWAFIKRPDSEKEFIFE